MIDNKELWNKYINDELDDLNEPEEEIEKLTHKRIVFCGTPEIAKAALEAICNVNEFEVVGVVSQPDKVNDRNHKITFQPVKQFALEKGLKFFQPNKIIEIKEELNNLKPDAIITCAYGQIMPKTILEIPKDGCFNLHASILPKYRGGAPIHWAIINGETKTGWTIMKMAEKMDAGDYCDQMFCEIEKEDTLETVKQKLIDLLEPLILFMFPKVFAKKTVWCQQDETKVTFAYNIKKEDRYLDFNLSAEQIYNKIRGLNNKPIALWKLNNEDVKVYGSKITNIKSNTTPGKIISVDKNGIRVGTKDFDLLITEIQLPNKNKVKIADAYNSEYYQKVFKN